MGTMTSQITSLTTVYPTVYAGADQRKHHLGGEFTGPRWIPLTKASDAEKFSIWWRHHIIKLPWCLQYMYVSSSSRS